MKIDKKLIINAAIGLAGIAAINAGIYFFLSYTQPKIGERAPGLVVQDSTAHGDSLAGGPALAEGHEQAQADSTKPVGEADTLTAPMAEHGTDSTAAVEPTAESKTPPETAENSKADSVAVDSAAAPAPEVSAEVMESGAASEEQTKQTAKLAKLLQSMKPNDAAAIVTSLKEEEIVALMMRMKDRNAALIMAALPLDQAAKVAMLMGQSATRK